MRDLLAYNTLVRMHSPSESRLLGPLLLKVLGVRLTLELQTCHREKLYESILPVTEIISRSETDIALYTVQPLFLRLSEDTAKNFPNVRTSWFPPPVASPVFSFYTHAIKTKGKRFPTCQRSVMQYGSELCVGTLRWQGLYEWKREWLDKCSVSLS